MSEKIRSHVTGGYYHVYNKTIDGKRPLENPRLLAKMKDITWYYRSFAPPIRYSDYVKASDARREMINELLLNPDSFRVAILSYCFMPTHYHFILKQLVDNGISSFMSQIQNSFTRYFNTLRSRKGNIFLHKFKSRTIESEEDMKHLSRYIYLNPYSCGYTADTGSALTYGGSSFSELSSKDNPRNIINPSDTLIFFNNNIDQYRQFVLQNAEYQKRLEGLD